jgi:hypothetical protein
VAAGRVRLSVSRQGDGEHPTGRRAAVVDVLMFLVFVIAIVACLWLIARAVKSEDD